MNTFPRTLSMSRWLCLAALPFLLSLVLTACGGSSGGTTTVVAEQGLRLAGPRTAGGDGEALAAAVLLSTGQPVARPGRLVFRLPGAQLEQDLQRLARRHVVTQAWGGPGGASLVGSARIRRLAAAANAVPDKNNNGTNLDEVLAADLAGLADLAGTTVDQDLQPVMFPWQTGDARFTAAIDPRNPGPGRATLRPTNQHVDMAQVGRAMRARVLMASGLLQQNRGSRPGASAADGMLGLALLQQVVAAEETLLASVFFDGRALSFLDAPRDYDPSQGFRWLPARFRVIPDQNNPSIPAEYGLVDGASSLEALAEMLHATAEIAFLASADNQNPNLRDLFHGSPFGIPPGSDPGRPTKPLSVAAAEVTWDREIKPLMAFRCAGCHGGPQPDAELSLETYEAALAGGKNSGASSSTPIIVKGEHEKSLMWQVLVAATSVSARMPKGSPPLPQGEQDLIADWIDQGVLKSPTQQPEPVRVGLDLTLVLLRNLRAMHLDKDGALHHRHEGDAPSGWVTSAATGRALIALSAAVQVLPTETEAKDTLQKAADFALRKLTDDQGHAVLGYDLETKTAEGQADLLAQANMTAGLLAAARTLDNAALEKRGLLLTDVLDKEFLEGGNLFRTDLRRRGKHYTPQNLAAVMDAMRESLAALGQAGDVLLGRYVTFLQRILPFLVFSEVDGSEVLGDGIPDTDTNGIPEPALAGDQHGRAPVFAGAVLVGPSPGKETVVSPVLWSRDIKPLFRRTCVGCHIDGAERGLYRVDTPTLLRQPGESGGRFPLVVPGKPEESLLYQKLRDRRPPIGEQMPLQQPPLDDRGKALVFRWIQEGARSR
ncbi:MAG: c-type cytochrome domain-containing protein [Planctomycetota bacterium]